MSNGKRRYFPGANTGRGFIGHFEGIVPPWSEPHYTYVLKGGPGVGKSTLMKKCAAIARANGFTVEEFRCASDPEALTPCVSRSGGSSYWTAPRRTP